MTFWRANLPGGDHTSTVICDPDLPQLLGPALADGSCVDVHSPLAHRAKEVRVVVDPDRDLPVFSRRCRSARARRGLDGGGVDAAMHDAPRLVLWWAEVDPAGHVISPDLVDHESSGLHELAQFRAGTGVICHGVQTYRVASYQATYYHAGMRRTSFENMNCSVAQCLEVVGEWWSLLIVRDAFLGVRRFDDFQARLGIARNVLNDRLHKLVDAGVFVRVPYQDRPPRFEYRLTDRGRDLWPVITSMRQWGDKWAAPEGPPLALRHTTCGHVAEAVMVCSECSETLEPRSVTAEPGLGAAEGDFERTPLAH